MYLKALERVNRPRRALASVFFTHKLTTLNKLLIYSPVSSIVYCFSVRIYNFIEAKKAAGENSENRFVFFE